QTTRKIGGLLKLAKRRGVVIRHPMPYGNLTRQEVQRYATLKDLKHHRATIEEREEYEKHIREGLIVYAGVNYEKILRRAEKEADVIIWDGGNNDFSFIKPDLLFVIVDPLRAGDEMHYHPGETNLRMADVIVINKENAAHPSQIKVTQRNIQHYNPKAKIIHADSVLHTDSKIRLRGKKVVVVEDGPTVTHGGMPFGAGTVFAKEKGAIILDPKPFLVGDIRKAFDKYPNLKEVIPALGYSKIQISELEKTLNKADCDYVVSGTPIDLGNIVKLNKPIVQVNYALKEKGKMDLKRILKQGGFFEKPPSRRTR
ncbi:MAG: GTPase, partial [archaeon]|nr:GTPase [archaeon]